MRVHAFVAVVCVCLIASAREDNATSALINEALDKPVTLQLDGILPDVLKTIETKTSVPIKPTDAVYDLLPWGEQTNIKAKIDNQNLREALTAISRKLGLTWELGQYEVWLKPMPALARLGKRATLAELQTLDLLSSTPLAQHNEKLTVQALVDAVDHQLSELKLDMELRPGDASDPQAGFINLGAALNVGRNVTLAGALDALAEQTDATWYPWGKSVVILPKQQEIRLQLDKTITAHFSGVDVARVLDKLAERSGVEFQIEPGAIQRIPQEYRSIKIELENATIRQVLDDIRGVTGLDYTIQPQGVYVWNQNSGATTRPANDPVVAMIQTGGLQVLLRESELPADVRAFLAHKRQQVLDDLRKQMKEQGFVPPATQPAAVSEPAQ